MVVSRRIGQVAVCVTDYRRSCNFYRQVLGLDHIFGTTSFRGEMAETIQGMPNADYDTWNPMLRNVRCELAPGSPVCFEVLQADSKSLKLSASKLNHEERNHESHCI